VCLQNLVNIMLNTNMPIKSDLKGEVFGRLVVTGEDPARVKGGRLKWFCNCSCGTLKSVLGYSLISGNTKSCGCLKDEAVVKRNTTHNLAHAPTYQVFLDMKRRCYNKRHVQYKNYGGRGIRMCDRWLESFENFHYDMITSYKKGLQIDRRDNDKGYYKENCRWVTYTQNNHNSGSLLDSSSMYKGVSKTKGDTGWVARIRREYLGRFTSEQEAAKAYNVRAKELFGEYAYLNKIEE